MAPAFHVRMPYLRTRRYSTMAGILLVVSVLCSTWLSIQFDWPKEIALAVMGSLLLALLAREALPMLSPNLAATNGLRISNTGIALARGGRTKAWRWEEISDIRIRRRLHPATLFLGRFITFRVPRDRRVAASKGWFGSLLGADTVAIGNDYPSRTDDLYRQIEFFRTAHDGGDRASLSGPEPVWSFRKNRKKPKLVHVLTAVGAPVVGTAIGMATFGDLPHSVGELLSQPGIIGTFSGMVGGLPLLMILLFRFEAKQDNLLVMSAGGLHTRFKVERRHWLWRDIIDMQVKQSASRGKDGNSARVVSFRASHDGSKPGKTVDQKDVMAPVSCSVEDVYEMPIDEIGRYARAWWVWSGETFGHAVVPAVADRLVKAQSPHVDGISFRRQTGTMNGRNSVLDQVVPLAALSPMLIYTLVLITAIKGGVDLGIPWWLDLALMAILPFGSIIGMLVLIQPGFNRLELNDEGLKYVRYGLARRWVWRDIGNAELRRVRTKMSAKLRPIVVLESDAPDKLSGLLRWVFNIGHHRRAVIEDIYDSSLDEIAEAINGMRRMHGGQVAG